MVMTGFTRSFFRSLGSAGLVLGLGLSLLLAGCASGPNPDASKKGVTTKYVFYPPPPEQPRLQFLVSLSDERDLGREVSRFSTFITGEQPTSQPIVKPYGVFLAGNELNICDTGTRSVDILNFVQKTMRRFTPTGMGKLGVPVNIVVDTDGTRYVADTGRNQVVIYGADDSYQGAIGDAEKFRPTGVAVSGDRIYITDLTGHCVQVYAKKGHEHLFTIPRDPEAADDKEPGKLYMPVNLALDPQGRLYVSDMASCKVQIYAADGAFLKTLGSRGDMPGQFARPKGITVDREGRVYVIDAAAQVCQIFNPEGKLLLYFGEPDGSAVPLNLPAGVAVDYDHVKLFEQHVSPDFVVEHLVLITNQLGDRKVNVYGLGHKR